MAKQDTLLRLCRRLVRILVGDVIAMWVAILAGYELVSYVLSFVIVLIFVAVTLIGRALHITGPPFDVPVVVLAVEVASLGNLRPRIRILARYRLDSCHRSLRKHGEVAASS